jgi:hypothetical protein
MFLCFVAGLRRKHGEQESSDGSSHSNCDALVERWSDIYMESNPVFCVQVVGSSRITVISKRMHPSFSSLRFPRPSLSLGFPLTVSRANVRIWTIRICVPCNYAVKHVVWTIAFSIGVKSRSKGGEMLAMFDRTTGLLRARLEERTRRSHSSLCGKRRSLVVLQCRSSTPIQATPTLLAGRLVE